MLGLKLNRKSFCLVILVLVVGVASTIGCLGKQKLSTQPVWQVYSLREPVLRLQVIASSDSEVDQLLKKQVVQIVRRQLSRQGEFASVEDCLSFVKLTLPCLEKEIRAYLQELAPGQQVSLMLARSNFPLRTYGNRVFPPGQYLALKVILGVGQGENWWCLLFPSLCVTLVESEPADQPLEPGGEEKFTGEKEPVHWRSRIWEWLERWF